MYLFLAVFTCSTIRMIQPWFLCRLGSPQVASTAREPSVSRMVGCTVDNGVTGRGETWLGWDIANLAIVGISWTGHEKLVGISWIQSAIRDLI